MSSKLEYFSENINHLQVVICDLCQKYFNGRIPYEQHLQSKNHKKKRQEQVVLEKMAEMKIRQSVLSKDPTNMEASLCNYTMISDNIPTKDVSDSFTFAKQPERYPALDDKVECLNTSFSVPMSYNSSMFSVAPSTSEMFYDKCVVCMKYFPTSEIAQSHFHSKEHKAKVEKQRQLEVFLNSYKEMNLSENTKSFNPIDKAKIIENLSAVDSINKYPYSGLTNHPVKITNTPNEQRMYSKFSFYSPNSKGIQDKMSLIDLPMRNSVDIPHYTSKSNEQKTFPGCDICGIKSFVTLNASFNHSLTLEHCRKFAMYAKTSDSHIFPEKYTSPPLPMNSPVSSSSLIKEDRTQLAMDKNKVFPSRTNIFGNSESNLKYEEGVPSSHGNTASLYPIGYERKMKCKQNEEQNTGITLHETISLPDSFNVDYGTGCYISYPLMRDTQSSFLDHMSSLNLPKSDSTECTKSEVESEQLSLKLNPNNSQYLGRRPPRIAARLTNSNITPPPPHQPKEELDDFTITSEDNFHF